MSDPQVKHLTEHLVEIYSTFIALGRVEIAHGRMEIVSRFRNEEIKAGFSKREQSQAGVPDPPELSDL